VCGKVFSVWSVLQSGKAKRYIFMYNWPLTRLTNSYQNKPIHEQSQGIVNQHILYFQSKGRVSFLYLNAVMILCYVEYTLKAPLSPQSQILPYRKHNLRLHRVPHSQHRPSRQLS
jgi:hypothetical protein